MASAMCTSTRYKGEERWQIVTYRSPVSNYPLCLLWTRLAVALTNPSWIPGTTQTHVTGDNNSTSDTTAVDVSLLQTAATCLAAGRPLHGHPAILIRPEVNHNACHHQA